MRKIMFDTTEIEKKIDDFGATLEGIIKRSNPLGTEGNISFAKIENKKFAKIHLFYRTFKNCVFSNVSFVESFFDKMHFENCLFVNTTFSKTTLNNPIFKNCIFSNVSFNKSMTYNIQFGSCSLRNVSFNNSKIDNNFVIAESKVENINFIQCVFEFAEPFLLIFCRVNLGTIIEFLNFDYVLTKNTKREQANKKWERVFSNNLLPYDTKRTKKDNKIFEKLFLKNLKPIEEVLNEGNFPKYRN